MHSSPLHIHHFVHSGHGVAGRRIRVWLPADYEREPTRRHAVLYLQDGQNMFEAATAFGGVAWRAGQTAQKLLDAGRIRPLILVGIDNSGAHRLDDYSPVAQRGRGGHAADYAAMLVDEIKPFVDAHYRTLPGPATTGLAGASLGGLFALHLGLTRPDVFGQVAALSPSVWWANGHLLRVVAATPARLPVRVWLDVGKQEQPQLRQWTRDLAELLLAKGWRKHRSARRADLRHVEVARGRHDEASWGRRFDRVLKFLFPAAAAARKSRRKAPGTARATTG